MPRSPAPAKPASDSSPAPAPQNGDIHDLTGEETFGDTHNPSASAFSDPYSSELNVPSDLPQLGSPAPVTLSKQGQENADTLNSSAANPPQPGFRLGVPNSFIGRSNGHLDMRATSKNDSQYRGLNPRPKAPRRVKAGILCSVAVHLFGIWAFLFEAANRQQLPPPVLAIEIIDPSQFQQNKRNAPEKQIVSPSTKAQKEAPTIPTNLRAENDQSVKKEQVKKGESEKHGALAPAGAPAISRQKKPSTPPPAKVQPKQSLIKPSEKKSLAANLTNNAIPKKATAIKPLAKPAKLPTKQITQKPKKLDLSPALNSLRLASANTDSTEKPKASIQKDLSGWRSPSVAPFSRPVGSNALFHGRLGQSDYLPGIKDGDVTLLNAKADKYAVFVRRVALRVFESIKSKGWQYLSASDIRGIADYGTIRAVITPKGALKKVIIESPSGSTKFDVMLNQAVTSSTSDPHPPADAAAADGNIHFIFMARTWSEMYQSARNPGIGERRWLILKAGLD
jgi:hypothetical protein